MNFLTSFSSEDEGGVLHLVQGEHIPSPQWVPGSAGDAKPDRDRFPAPCTPMVTFNLQVRHPESDSSDRTVLIIDH